MTPREKLERLPREERWEPCAGCPWLRSTPRTEEERARDKAQMAAVSQAALSMPMDPRIAEIASLTAERDALKGQLAAQPDTTALIAAFVDRVNARAEADMLKGRPITGAHHRAITAELAAMNAKRRERPIATGVSE